MCMIVTIVHVDNARALHMLVAGKATGRDIDQRLHTGQREDDSLSTGINASKLPHSFFLARPEPPRIQQD